MSIIKKAKNHEEQSHADANAAGAAGAGSTPAFEGEQDNGTVVENGAGTVKTVTRSDVGAGAGTEDDAGTGSTQANATALTKGVEDAADKAPETQPAGEAAPESKQTAIIARNSGGQLKTLLNNGRAGANPLAELKDAFKTAGVEIDYGTFPRLRVDAGCIATAEGKEAGDWIELQVVSYSPSWTVTAGVDGDEGKKHVRFSDDGKVTNAAGDADEFAGVELETYRDHLKGLGFEKASIKEYMIVYGIALDAEEADFAHLNEVVALSLAPQSKTKFESYKINRAIQAKMGRIQETNGNPVVRWTSERTKGANNTSFFNLIPSHGKTAPLDLAS